MATATTERQSLDAAYPIQPPPIHWQDTVSYVFHYTVGRNSEPGARAVLFGLVMIYFASFFMFLPDWWRGPILLTCFLSAGWAASYLRHLTFEALARYTHPIDDGSTLTSET